jgi:hypothetical protein
MFPVLIIAIVGYILYKFILGFVLPVYRTTSQVRGQFKQMQEQAKQRAGAQAQQQNPFNGTETTPNKRPKTTSGKPGAREDYLDYEELSSKHSF